MHADARATSTSYARNLGLGLIGWIFLHPTISEAMLEPGPKATPAAPNSSRREGASAVPTILIKRVYDPPDGRDGLRILVDRLWPRGLRRSDALLHCWRKELAPSPDLRRWFDHRPERFAEFSGMYRSELATNPDVPRFLAEIGDGTVTLLYGARDPAINHAAVLAEFLASWQR